MVHDPEVGAIVVGSPTPFHAEQIIEAAKLGSTSSARRSDSDLPSAKD